MYNVYLLTRLLHLEPPAGAVVVVGVAVVLQVGVVPLYHHAELAALRTPSRRTGLSCEV